MKKNFFCAKLRHLLVCGIAFCSLALNANETVGTDAATQPVKEAAHNSELVAVTSALDADKKTIAGLIKDRLGDPLVGVSVVVEGTTIGATTDLDGRFELDVPENARLNISYIGFKAQKINIRNQTRLEIVLDEDLQALEEVVVVGYTTQRKADLTCI